MRVLALDTALGATAVALYDAAEDRVLAEESQMMERGQAEALMPMVKRVMAGVSGGFAAVDRYAVTIGPGSFTGLRIGIAAARAFGLAHKKPVVGVSTLAAYAAPILSGDAPVTVASVVDARHAMVFFHLIGVDGRTLAGPGLFTVEEAVRKAGDGSLALVGNVPTFSHKMGRGHRVLTHAAPDIGWVARLGAAAEPAYAPAQPLYLREANAAPQEAGRIRLA
jgi:tRNA threonylcarbamoyladenosine biosynthesis protein TsaB